MVLTRELRAALARLNPGMPESAREDAMEKLTRVDLVCFVNGLPLLLIELKAVYKNIRAKFDDNLTDY